MQDISDQLYGARTAILTVMDMLDEAASKIPHDDNRQSIIVGVKSLLHYAQQDIKVLCSIN